MARICRCCASKQRAQIDKDILANRESASTIARRHAVTKASVLGHRRNHLAEAVEGTLSQGALELKAMLSRADKLIKLLTHHLKAKPRDAVSLDWIRESRDLRGWLTYRSKHVGKLVPVGDRQERAGDRYVISFIAPDGRPAEIPLGRFRRLPASKDGAEKAEQSLPDCNNDREERTSDEPVTT
jgi:hypothetical protein